MYVHDHIYELTPLYVRFPARCQLCKRAHNLIHLNLAVAMAASGLVLIFGVHPIPPIQLVSEYSQIYICTIDEIINRNYHPPLPLLSPWLQVYYIFDVYPSTVCLISSAVVHFCVTSSFVWLMCEAILLVAMVTKLNSSCIGCGCFLFLFGWGECKQSIPSLCMHAKLCKLQSLTDTYVRKCPSS